MRQVSFNQTCIQRSLHGVVAILKGGNALLHIVSPRNYYSF